jgi:hypothetical protein
MHEGRPNFTRRIGVWIVEERSLQCLDKLNFYKNAPSAVGRWKSAENIKAKKLPALIAAAGLPPSMPRAILWISGTKTTTCSTEPINYWINALPAVSQ